MELSQLLLNQWNAFLMGGLIFGGLLLLGILLFLFFSGSAIHRAPLIVKENSLPIRPSMRTASEGPMVSSRRHPSKHPPLPVRSGMYPRANAARNVSTMNRV